MNTKHNLASFSLLPLVAILTACGGPEPGPLPVNTPPVIQEPGSIQLLENLSQVTSLEISDLEGNPIQSELSGADSNAFIVDNQGNVSFNDSYFEDSVPDFENPEDANGDNVYELTISATDGFTTPTVISFTVTITDEVSEAVEVYNPVVPTTLTNLTEVAGIFNESNLIESFERPIDYLGLPKTFTLTGVFADPDIANRGWSNFNSIETAAFVGASGVSTCEIDGSAGNCDGPTGSWKIKNVTITQPYIQFLMSGGNGGNDVGIKVSSRIQTDSGREEIQVGQYTPNSCSDAWIKGDQNWVYFDVSDSVGKTINIEIYDNEETGCGFIAFDHLYQTETFFESATFAGRVVVPSVPGQDSDNDGVEDNEDAFPNNPNETVDSDSDGTGDNADAFPNDPSETTDSDNDGVGDNKDSRPNDPNVTLAAFGVTLNDEAIDSANIIADFDDPVAIYNDNDKYSLTGVFDDADAAAVGWNNFSQAAYVGTASVATCEFNNNANGCDAPVGSVTVNDVTLTKDYLTMLIAGSNGTAPVGVRINSSESGEELQNFIPATCGVSDPWITGDNNWIHFDVSALNGNVVDITIYDDEAGGCGFLAFDHIYQGDIAVGTLAGTLVGDGVLDTDLDGVSDVQDAFPNDPTESSDADNDGVGDNKDSRPNDPNVTLAAVGVTLNDEAINAANIIESFDDPVAIVNDTDGYAVTGIFANADAASVGWNNFSQAAYVGQNSVATCEFNNNAEGCDAPVGSVTVKNVEMNNRYLTMLLAGSNGSAPVGVRIIQSSNQQVLADFIPSTCGVSSPWITGDTDWVHFDLADLQGLEIDIQLYDEEAGGCGFLAFDHIYQGNIAVGTLAGTLSVPDTDSDNDGVPDNQDAFPNDPSETTDSDDDGVGDNADAFPNDPTETLDTDDDGTGDNADADPNDPNVSLAIVLVTANEESTQTQNIISSFDDVAAIQSNTEKYSLTGAFVDATNWNDLQFRDDSARIGPASVSTCEIGDGNCDAPTGRILINNVEIQGDYINFLMSGGNGSNDVGVKILLASDDDGLDGIELASYTPNFCGNPVIASDEHWTNFDVSALIGLTVDILIYDDEEGGCGFLAFDHFYQGDISVGTSVSTISQPLTPTNLAFDSSNALANLISGGSFEDPIQMLSNGWVATGAFVSPANNDAWTGTARAENTAAARIGARAVSTCELNDNSEGCDAPVGTLLSPIFKVTNEYLQFLMAGGNGSAPVGLKVKDTLGNDLVEYRPNSCGPSHIDGDNDWTYIDTSSIVNAHIQVELFDNEPGGCGFVSFDHIYQTPSVFNPDVSINGGVVSATDNLGFNVLVDASSFEQVIGNFNSANEMLGQGWIATGAFENPENDGSWSGTTRESNTSSARVGSRAVSTCELNDNRDGCDAPTGTLTSPGFIIDSNRPYLSLLMAGGDGSGLVGIKVIDSSDDTVLSEFNPNSCGPANIDGDDDWVSIDLSGHVGQSVKVELFDNNPGGCGFVSFDHLHMTAESK